MATEQKRDNSWREQPLKPKQVSEVFKDFAFRAAFDDRVLKEVFKKHGYLSGEKVKQEFLEHLPKLLAEHGKPILTSEGNIKAGDLYDIIGGYLDSEYTIPHSKSRALFVTALANTVGLPKQHDASIEQSRHVSEADLAELTPNVPRAELPALNKQTTIT